ncbi:isoprenylcysteine carboxylmethyltransferase family protein [Paracoccaceae bacterium Fryx2]|nr:isoprenylcysteine carboxylmethyltransferase family protein [Paracoccaceae bacterium Fryx2]
MQKLLDFPPVWLLAFVGAVKLSSLVLPWGVFGSSGRSVGAVLAIIGVGLSVVAAAQMARRRTTVIPHRRPSALVTGGVFRLTRNPIYLGDTFLLAAAILWWDVPLAAPLLAIFMLVIQARFILPEESRLRAAFGAEFEAWAARTRRWM